MQHRITQIMIGLALATLSHAQTPAPEFDVASIKLNPNCANYRGGRGAPFSTGRVNMECTTLQDLIQSAYGLFADGANFNQEMIQMSISGGPGWVQSDRYDLAAKAEGAAPVSQMMGPMLRALLEDRFKLKIRRESKETPVYALTAVKSGFKLQPVKEGSCIPIDFNHLPEPPEPGQPRPNYCGNMSMRMGPQGASMDAHSLSLRDFCARLSTMGVDRKVIDKTGIVGLFDFHLEYTRDGTSALPGRGGDGGGNPPLAAPDGPSIFSALQEQLGLKLTPDKAPVESLVIDHVEKPAAN